MQTLNLRKKTYFLAFFIFFCCSVLKAETRCEDLSTNIKILVHNHITFPRNPSAFEYAKFLTERLNRAAAILKKNIFSIPLTLEQQELYAISIRNFHEKFASGVELDCQELENIFQLNRILVAEQIKITQKLIEEGNFEADLSLKVTQTDPDKLLFPNAKAQEKHMLSLAHQELISAQLNPKLGTREALEDYHVQLTRLDKALKKSPKSDVYDLYLESLAQGLDPHTSFLNQSAQSDFKFNLGGESFSGIGAQIGIKGKYPQIASISEGSSADALLKKAKEDAQTPHIQPDDLILGVSQDGQTYENTEWLETNEVVDKIRGPTNTIVYLKILRKIDETQSQELIVPITRANVTNSANVAKHKDIQNNGKTIRVIQIDKFYDNNDEEYNKGDVSYDVAQTLKIAPPKNSSLDAVILDLRNNGGGHLGQAINLTQLFSKKEVVVKIHSPGEETLSLRENNSAPLDAQDEFLYKGPLVVLINDSSASASEIVAGALKDYGRALIIGTAPQSFGKGSVQTMYEISEAFPYSESTGSIKSTTAFFYLPSGKSTQYHGVSSDVLLGPLEYYKSKTSYTNERILDYALQAPEIDQELMTQANLALSEEELEYYPFLKQSGKRPSVALELQKISAQRLGNSDFFKLRLEMESLKKKNQDLSITLAEWKKIQQKKNELDERLRKLIGIENEEDEKEFFKDFFTLKSPLNKEALDLTVDYLNLL